MYVHKMGIFLPNGTGHSFGVWTSMGGWLPVAPPTTEHHPQGHYHLPMDDSPEEWLRLFAEYQVHCHPEVRTPEHPDYGCAHPSRVRHEGGLPHQDPRLGHVRLGGSVRVHPDHPTPHPRVQAIMDRYRAHSLRGMLDAFCGEHLTWNAGIRGDQPQGGFPR